MSSQSQCQRQSQIEWCRAKALELLSKGEISQSEIARRLQVDRSTIYNIVDQLRKQAKEKMAYPDLII